MSEDHDPSVGEHLAYPQDVTGRLEMTDVDDVEGLVEEDFLADLELLHLDVGLGGDPQLPAPR